MPNEIELSRCGILPAADTLIVRRYGQSMIGGIALPGGGEKGTEAEIVAIPHRNCGFALGEIVFVARTVGVPIEDDGDLWFVGTDDILGYREPRRENA